MLHSNDIKKEYIQTKESLRSTFPEAYKFLMRLETLLNNGFHIGTSKNLHFYLNNNFLFYFSKISSKVISISSIPNGIIKKGTINKSSYFFDLLLQRLNNEKGIEINKGKGLKIVINQSDTSEFIFQKLHDCLIEISDEKNLSLFDSFSTLQSNISNKRQYQISQTWQILIKHALEKQSIHYKEIGEKVGFNNPQQVGKFLLEPILVFCIENKLPLLTVVVIDKKLERANYEDGINNILQKMGHDTIPIENEKAELENVFSFNWTVIKNPFQNINDTVNENEQEELEEFYKTKSKAEILKELESLEETDPIEIEINHKTYKRDNKTVAQIKILRDFKCQICSITILKKGGSKYIEAAHIKAKHKKGRETLENILLLCPNHHKEFDYGNLEIINHTQSEIEFVLNKNRYKIPLTININDNI